jgi:uncharacterized RDD family membrane protein YckC
MKKILMITIALLTLALTAGVASAWPGHPHFGFGLFIAPPAIWAPPPVYYRAYYPPYGYYGPDYYDYGYRVWVPGRWQERWTPYGWRRYWVPGYWEYRR